MKDPAALFSLAGRVACVTGASAGLGQQLHFDAFANLFFHLHGEKHVVLAPPDAVVDDAHLFPNVHPASRQSALAWSAPSSARRPDGYSTPAGADRARPPPAYSASRERVARLRPGDVLFIPPYWGHQTFSADRRNASVSLALWCLRAPSGSRGGDPPDVRSSSFFLLLLLFRARGLISHARRALLSLPSAFALRVLRYYPTARDPTSSAGPPPGALRGQASRELRERLVIGLLRRAQPRARALWACARGFGERAVGCLLYTSPSPRD